MIECISIYGNKKMVSEEKLIFRAGAYGVIAKDSALLLMNTKSTGKFWLPGGGVGVGEKLEDALKREVKEESGIEVRVERLLHFEETFFYYDPLDEAYHSLSFFFICTPVTTNLLPDHMVNDLESDKPRWVDVKGLQPADFQPPVDKVFGIFKKANL